MSNKTLRRNRVVPEHERFNRIEGRRFFYLDANEKWKECSQGRYNLMLANDYTVWYADSAAEHPDVMKIYDINQN